MAPSTLATLEYIIQALYLLCGRKEALCLAQDCGGMVALGHLFICYQQSPESRHKKLDIKKV
jgi:hypothetical protein